MKLNIQQLKCLKVFFFMISMFTRNIFILCGRHKTSFNALYIVPLSSPGKITGLYIGTTDFVKLMCHAREVFPGRGFSSGASIAEKWGLEIFWGKCLKITKFSDVYFLCN